MTGCCWRGCTGSFDSLGQTRRLPEVCRVNRRHPSRPSSRGTAGHVASSREAAGRLSPAPFSLYSAKKVSFPSRVPVSSPVSAFFHRFYDVALCSRTPGVLLELPAVENQRFYGIVIKIWATSKLGDLLAAISERDCGNGRSQKGL